MDSFRSGSVLGPGFRFGDGLGAGVSGLLRFSFMMKRFQTWSTWCRNESNGRDAPKKLVTSGWNQPTRVRCINSRGYQLTIALPIGKGEISYNPVVISRQTNRLGQNFEDQFEGTLLSSS